MSEFEYESRPAGREGLEEFLAGLQKTDPDMVADMSAAASAALLDHQAMKDAVYWLSNNGAEPGADAVKRRTLEQRATDIACRFAVDTVPEPHQIGEIVKRYVDMTPTGKPRRV